MCVGLVVESLFSHIFKFRVLECVSGHLGCLPICSMQMLGQDELFAEFPVHQSGSVK